VHFLVSDCNGEKIVKINRNQKYCKNKSGVAHFLQHCVYGQIARPEITHQKFKVSGGKK